MGRETRRLLQRHRDAAQISLGRIPAGPESMPVLERYLAVLAAAGLPPRVIALRRRHVRALRRRLRVRGEHAGARRSGTRAPRRHSSPTTSARCPRTSSRRSSRLADDLTAGDADERFEFALDLLVRGLEAMAERER